MLELLPELIASRLSVAPVPSTIVLLFFSYSFFGYVLECVVLSLDNKTLVVNRGFVDHLPFCIIYGFGALAGYALLRPFADNMLLLFFAGAAGATVFEYLVARLQTRLFGDFWWDYNEKPFNYQGIVCLESTLAWGAAAIVVVRIAHAMVAGVIRRIPPDFANILAVVLLVAYTVDFVVSARAARIRRIEEARTAELYIED